MVFGHSVYVTPLVIRFDLLRCWEVRRGRSGSPLFYPPRRWRFIPLPSPFERGKPAEEFFAVRGSQRHKFLFVRGVRADRFSEKRTAIAIV
jgi:hypothetical protein